MAILILHSSGLDRLFVRILTLFVLILTLFVLILTLFVLILSLFVLILSLFVQIMTKLLNKVTPRDKVQFLSIFNASATQSPPSVRGLPYFDFPPRRCF
jgi:hypothetical protein